MKGILHDLGISNLNFIREKKGLKHLMVYFHATINQVLIQDLTGTMILL